VEDIKKYYEEPEEIVNFNFDNRSDAIAFNYQAKKQGLALRAKEFESPQSRGQTSHLAVDTKKLKTIGPKLKKLAKKYMGRFSTTTVNDKNFEKMMREDVQLDETMTARDLESMIKGLKKGAKQEIADVLNDMNLGGYGDYEARVDNVHKFKTKDLFNAMKKVMKLESLKMSLDEKQKMTYVIDRKTKKIVLGPTGVADAKRYLEKQIQPRKFMIRDIRGAAKKVGDTV
jgi:cytochrome c551/c552